MDRKALFYLYLDYLMIYKSVFFYTFVLLTHLGIIFGTSFLLIAYGDEDIIMDIFWLASWFYSCFVVEFSIYYKLTPHRFIVNYKQRRRIMTLFHGIEFTHFLIFVATIIQEKEVVSYLSIISIEVSILFFTLVYIWWIIGLNIKAKKHIKKNSTDQSYGSVCTHT